MISYLERDRSHRWLYTTTEAGDQRIAEVLERVGLEAPINLGKAAGGRALPMFVMLSEASRHDGGGQVVSWRSGADVAWWLRQRHGIGGVQADAYGIWAEGDRAIRFLVQVDADWTFQVTDRLLDQLTETAGPVLPVNVMLLIAELAVTEKSFHSFLGENSPNVAVATTTKAHLYGEDGPAGAIWPMVGTPARHRLIELADIDPSGYTLPPP